jgi:hypothetical protein
VTSIPRGVRIGAVIAVAIVIFLVVWLIVRSNESSRNGPSIASAGEIQQLAGSASPPIYWAGALPGRDYELTRTRTNSVYIRYLPSGAQAGDPRPSFLTVATYPQRDGFKAVSASTKEPKTVKRDLPNGGLAVYGKDRPSSVFLSYPGANYQVEVYDPSPGRALRFVTSGRIVPVRG